MKLIIKCICQTRKDLTTKSLHLSILDKLILTSIRVLASAKVLKGLMTVSPTTIESLIIKGLAVYTKNEHQRCNC